MDPEKLGENVPGEALLLCTENPAELLRKEQGTSRVAAGQAMFSRLHSGSCHSLARSGLNFPFSQGRNSC